MVYSLIGFTYHTEINLNRYKYIKKFYEELPNFINRETKKIGEVFMNYASSSFGGLGWRIKKLEVVVEKIKPELIFFKNELKK